MKYLNESQTVLKNFKENLKAMEEVSCSEEDIDDIKSLINIYSNFVRCTINLIEKFTEFISNLASQIEWITKK